MDSEKDSVIYVRLAPQNITDVNCIMEGYEYLALVTTVDRISGIIKLSATPRMLHTILLLKLIL